MTSSRTPRHRTSTSTPPSTRASRLAAALRRTLTLTGLASVATAVAVVGGVLSSSAPGTLAGSWDVVQSDATLSVAEAPVLTAADLAERQESVASRSASRTDRREPLVDAKEATLSTENGKAVTVTEDLSTGDPRQVAQALLGEFGFSQDQFSCLDSLWTKESGWSTTADNPTSSAYGIPQALPGSKMASAGADWATNPATQIRWGLGYIQARYGSPCAAWDHSQANNWY